MSRTATGYTSETGKFDDIIVSATATVHTLNVTNLNLTNGIVTPNGTASTIGTSGSSSSLTIYGTASVAALLACNGGLTVSSGSTSVLGLSATTISASGLITGSNGLTISSGTTSLQALSAASCTIAGATQTNTLVSTTSSSLAAATATSLSSGSITVTSGTVTTLTSSTVNTAALNASSTSSLAATNVGGNLTVATGNTFYVGTTDTITPSYFYGTITGYNGLLLTAGSATLQDVSCMNIAIGGDISITGALSTSSAQSTFNGNVSIASNSSLSVSGTSTFSNLVTMSAGLRYSYKSVSASSYTLSTSDCFVECTAGTGTVSVTLPLLTSGIKGLMFTVINATSNSAVVEISASASDLIDGNITLISLESKFARICIIAGSGTWYIL